MTATGSTRNRMGPRRATIAGEYFAAAPASVPSLHDARPAGLGRGGAGQRVGVPIRRGGVVVTLRLQEGLLEHVGRDHVLAQNRVGRNLAVGFPDRVLPRDRPITEFLVG